MARLKHILLLLSALLLLSLCGKAQQAPIFTDHSSSFAHINPGYLGMSEGVNIMGLYRNQWAGFTDSEGNDIAPETFLLTGDVPISLLGGGVGLSVMHDKIGFEKNINVGLGYSFHLDLGGSTLGIGLCGALLNRTTDFSKYKPGNSGDPILQGLGEESSMMFDFNAGLFWQIPESFFLGVSALNILETTSKALAQNNENSASYTTDRTFYAVAGYPFRFETLPAFVFVPSVCVMSNLASTQLNVNAKVIYNNVFSMGVNYRPQESVGLMAGLIIKDIYIGYAYDINMMKLGVPGSHELSVGYCFKLDLDRTPRDYRSVRYL